MSGSDLQASLEAEVGALKRRIAELEAAPPQDASTLRFLDAMNRVARVVRGTQDVDQLLRGVLDEMLDIFGCDRAWLLYPCAPDAPSWRVPMERTVEAWPGAESLAVEVPMDAEVEALFSDALAVDEPRAYGGSAGRAVPEAAQAFHVKSQLVMAVRPKTDLAWLLGIHCCGAPRDFTMEERRIFKGICHRIADALSTLVILRDLRESEQRFRTLVEHAPDAIVVATPEGRFVDANPNALALFGVSRAELLQMRVADISPPVQPDERPSAQAAAEAIARALEGEITRFEWTHQDSGGRQIPCEVRLVRLDGATPLVRGSVIDITERLSLERQLYHLQKMEAIGELAGGIAHDFNNKLLVILCYAEMLRDMKGAPPRVGKLSERIRQSASDAADLTRELLAFSRRSVLRPQVVAVSEILQSQTTLLRRAVGSRIEILLDLDEAPALARVDRQQLDQVIVNLVTNARDAMPEGGTIRIQTGHHRFDGEPAASSLGLSRGSYVYFSVADDGVGMDADTLARVFEPFFTTKDVGKGTGLGLSMAYGVVRQSGGAIEGRSTPGAGTTFTVYLPEAGTEPDPVEVVRPQLTRGGTETILLVEDSESVAEVAVEVLGERGYQVVHAPNGEEAVRLVAGGCRPDLLLTDVVMPGMDGIAVAQRLWARFPDIPVIYASGYSAGAVSRLVQTSARVRLLQKPYSAQRLLEQVREALDEG